MKILSKIIVLILIVIISGCEKDDENSSVYPTLITKDVIEINSTGATFDAEVKDYGKEEIIDFGFIWYNSESEYSYSLYKNEGTINDFRLRVSSDLELNKVYTCKAYINTINNQVYGNEVTFKGLGSKSPLIKDFNPKEGFDGTKVILTGKYFSQNPINNKVLLNGINSEITYSNSDTIIFETPHVAFSGEVHLQISVGSNSIIADSTFNILGPKIIDFDPQEGFDGTQVTLNAQYLSENLNENKIYVHGIEVQVINLSGETITFKTPQMTFYGETDISLQVDYKKDTSDTKFKVLGPKIIDFNPKEGFDETIVVITSEYLSEDINENKVFINNELVEIMHLNEDTIVFKTPQMAFYGEAEITLQIGLKIDTSEIKFKILGPHIETISSLSGYSGEYLIIEGNNFIKNGENLEVYFGTYEAQIISYSDTKIEVVIPPPPDYSLLSDFSATISVVNGFKSAEYDEHFVINKSWEQKQETPFSWGWKYKAFTYNDIGYILELNTKQLYEYDPNINQWNVISDFPGERYDGSLYIVHNDKLMKIGGYSTSLYTDFWVYDFTNDVWTQKTDIPFTFHYANYFILDNEIFIITTDSQVWKYSVNDELFTRLNDFPTTFEFFVFSFTNNGIAYAVSSDKTLQYEKLNDNWIEISTNSFSKEAYSEVAIGFAYKETGYVLQSGKDLYRFDLERNQWILSSNYPGPYGYNSYKTIFVINEKAYVAATSANYSGGAPLMYGYQD